MRAPVALLAIGASVCVLLAGCADPQTGDAQPADTTVATTGNGGSTRTGTPTHPTTSASPLDALEPCELLSEADRAQLNLEPGKPGKVAGSKICDWNSDRWGLTVGPNTDLAFKDANLRGATASRVSIGRHEAYEVRNAGGGDGGCEVFIITGESSFVQVTAGTFSGSNTPFACEKAIAVSKIIDPKLP